MRFVLIAFTLAASLAPSPQARAWNDTGHMTVALIAYRQLSDAHRQQIAELLRHHPHHELYLTQARDAGVDADEWAFLRASHWSDFVRPARPGSELERYKGPQITQYHRGGWHFITMPWVANEHRAAMDPTTLPSRIEPNVLTALDENTKLLADDSAPPAERAVALAWIEHCVGDMHQPLHACTMFSPQYSEGDKGGNEICVRANGNVMRLHQVWDQALGTSDAYLAVDFLARQITTDPMLARGRLTELETGRTFDAWAMESYHWAIALAHLNGRLQSAPNALWAEKKIPDDAVPNLPPSYLANVRELSKRRVALAGHRLAATIAGALDE